MQDTDYYDSDDYLSKSPRLTPIASHQVDSFLIFNATPLWMSQDIYGCPLVGQRPKHLFTSLLNLMQSLADQDIHPFGLIDPQTWRRKYGMFAPLNEYDRFQDTILLHHMAPNHPDLTLSLGMRQFGSDSESDSNSDADTDVADESNTKSSSSLDCNSDRVHKNLKRRRTGENKQKRVYLGRGRFKRNVRYVVYCSPSKHHSLTRSSVLLVCFHNADSLGFSHSDTLVIPQPSTRLHRKFGT